jgi:hypothetical protein
MFLFKMSWAFKTSYAISIFSSKSLGNVVLLDANGQLGIKIEQTTSPEYSTKSPNST